MAIRKIRKNMKVPIAIFAGAFILSILYMLVVGVKDWKSSQRHALKLNGKKIDAMDIERTFNQGIQNFKNSYGDALSNDEIKLISFNQMIEQELLTQSAKSLKVKVSKKEVNAEYDKVEAQFPDKETFARALQFQGYTKASLKAELKDALLSQKVQEKVEESAVVTEEEIKKYYEENKFDAYYGQDFEAAKGQIEERLLNLKKMQALRAFIEEQKEAAVYEWSEGAQYEQYKEYQPEVAYEVDGYKFTEVDLLTRGLMQRMYGLTDPEALDKSVKDGINREVRTAMAAKEAGVVVDEGLSQADQIFEYTQKLRAKLIAEANVSDKDIEDYFSVNGAMYDTRESADMNIMELELKIGESDQKAAEEKANKVLVEAQKGTNFAQLAMKYSDGPTGPKGGDLGTFKKGQMVPEFDEAIFGGAELGVYPEVVKTQFGYHIINIAEVNGDEAKASHILIEAKVGGETLALAEEKASEIVEKLNNEEATFEEVAKESSILKETVATDVTEGGYIQGIGAYPQLSTALLNAEDNVAEALIGERVFVFVRTAYTPYKKANLEEIKDKVKYDVAREQVAAEMTKIANGTM